MHLSYPAAPRGVPLRTTQETSGHTNLQELYTYLEISEPDLQEAVNKVKFK